MVKKIVCESKSYFENDTFSYEIRRYCTKFGWLCLTTMNSSNTASHLALKNSLYFCSKMIASLQDIDATFRKVTAFCFNFRCFEDFS